MSVPYITFIMVNYNSMHIIDVVLKSIRVILGFKDLPIELIIIDNGSTDGSDEAIKNYLSQSNVKVKFLKLKKNLGFAGANFLAYKFRNPKSKYVVLINNDVIPLIKSIKKLVEYLDKDTNVAGVQGLLLRFDKKIDAAGPYITSFWDIIDRKDIVSSFKELMRESEVTYLDCAFAIFRVEALEKCKGLFIPCLFSYAEDLELGLRLWSCGYILKFIPVIVGFHLRGGTFGKTQFKNISRYFNTRNIHGVMMIYDSLWYLKLLIKLPILILQSIEDRIIIRGIYDAFMLRKKLIKDLEPFSRRNSTTLMLRVPMIRVSLIKYYAHQIKRFLYKVKVAKECKN